MKNKWLKVGVLTIGIVSLVSFSGCTASWDREMKSTVSNVTGGLNRTVRKGIFWTRSYYRRY